jgi:hypothetical protein
MVMDTQFILKVLNSLMPEYGTQVKLLEKRVNKAGDEGGSYIGRDLGELVA